MAQASRGCPARWARSGECSMDDVTFVETLRRDLDGAVDGVVSSSDQPPVRVVATVRRARRRRQAGRVAGGSAALVVVACIVAVAATAGADANDDLSAAGPDA